MQLIDLVKDGKELVNTEDSGNVSTLQASMLSGLTDKAIVHSQKKVSSYCVKYVQDCTQFECNSPLSQGGYIAPRDQKSFVLPR